MVRVHAGPRKEGCGDEDSDTVQGMYSVLNKSGGLAQLARAPALQAGGQRFESVILHRNWRSIEVVEK